MGSLYLKLNFDADPIEIKGNLEIPMRYLVALAEGVLQTLLSGVSGCICRS